MQRGWRDEPEAHGGCQCGAVRYAISAGPGKSVVCHCRMCQRATGNAFAALLEVPSNRIVWTGQPAEWASSDIAWRGFCSTCGTPLFYRSGDTTEIMAGTLAPGFVFRPHENISVESRVDWLAHLPDLPEIRTPEAWRVASRQSPE
jgi:hypothetical protein